MNKSKISICIPIHDIPETAIFLARLLVSIDKQTFKDYEIIITKEGKMAENTNAAIKKAKGEIVKIMFMDDWFAHPNSLEEIVKCFDDKKTYWSICGADTNPTPTWNDEIVKGKNTLGSPSALAFRNKKPLLFDKEMSWLLDCDLYHRLDEKYGKPTILEGTVINIGTGPHQMTNKLTNEEKLAEHKLIMDKYGK